MKQLFISTCCILFLHSVKSQDSSMGAKSGDTILNPRFYMAYIYMFDHTKASGFLANIKDSSIYLSAEKTALMSENVFSTHLIKYDYSYIQRVKVAKPHVKGKSILIGAVIGMVAGAAIGFASGDDQGWFALNAGEKAVVGGIIGAGAGCLVGGIVGSNAEKKFLINGDWKSLQEMKESLLTSQ